MQNKGSQSDCLTVLSKVMFFMSKIWIVARRLGCQLATTVPVLTARGKPSTWFPRGRLVEQSRQDKTQKRRQKARTEKENPPATAAAHKKSPPQTCCLNTLRCHRDPICVIQNAFWNFPHLTLNLFNFCNFRRE